MARMENYYCGLYLIKKRKKLAYMMLNSKTFLLGKSIGTGNAKNLNNIHDGIYFYNGWGWDLKPPTNGKAPFINGTGIWIRMTLDSSTIDIVISGKDAIIYTSENKANSWTAK